MEPKTELEKNAVSDERRKALDTFQRALDMQWLNSRMEDGRMGQCLALIQREADMEKNYHERTDHAAMVNSRTEKEIALGLEIAKVRHDEVCQLLRRHYLREKDPALRELTRKLQAAYTCRDLKLQIRDNEYRRLQEKAEERQANSLLMNALFNNKEAAENEEKEHMEKCAILRKELQQQLVNREKARQCAYEDTLIEKKMLEEVMKTIADEDHREIEVKRSTRERIRKEMETFKAAREAWKLKQKEMGIREERELEKQRAADSLRALAEAEERINKQRLKEEITQKIGAKIRADEEARKERENIISMLQEQEKLEKGINEEIAEKEKEHRVKKETMITLTQQMNEKKKIAMLQKITDIEIRKKTESSVALEEQKEREKQKKLKEKKREYAAELASQIARDRERRSRDREAEERRAQNVWDYDKAWQEEVSKERKEIIREHAPPLLGHLQVGVLRHEDMPVVREGANLRGEPYSKLDVEAMGANRHRSFDKCNPQCKIIREY